MKQYCIEKKHSLYSAIIKYSELCIFVNAVLNNCLFKTVRKEFSFSYFTVLSLFFFAYRSGDNCLRRDDTSAVLVATGSPPGQVFPPDEQCKLMFDTQSVMWRVRCFHRKFHNK